MGAVLWQAVPQKNTGGNSVFLDYAWIELRFGIFNTVF